MKWSKMSKSWPLISDFLGKGFQPIKTEVKNHIKVLDSIQRCQASDSFNNIIDILNAERLTKKGGLQHSATSALLWLSRHLQFLHHFLVNILETEASIQACLHSSYQNTLAKFHDAVIRNVYEVIME